MGNYIFNKAKKSNSSSSSSRSSSNSKKTLESSSDNNNKMTSPIIIQPTIKQTATLIFLHGLGDTGHGWSYAFREIKKPHIKYIFPTAPVRSVTLNMGMQMNAWFDLLDLAPGSKQDEEGIKQSSQTLLSLVEDEIKNGIPSDRIIIGGFSQGGATALYTAASSPLKFGGVLALSTWLPLHERLSTFLDKSPEKFKTPVLQCHGDADPLIPNIWAASSSQMLQSVGFSDVKFKTYQGLGHSSTEEEMDDVKDFINKVVS